MVSTSTGVAVLGTGLEPREFPQVEHPLLCKRKLTLCHHGVQERGALDEHASLLSNRRVRPGLEKVTSVNFITLRVCGREAGCGSSKAGASSCLGRSYASARHHWDLK